MVELLIVWLIELLNLVLELIVESILVCGRVDGRFVVGGC